jgi:hypothetical protein
MITDRPLRIHLLTQYLWPDSAPTGLLAESLGEALTEAGLYVTLVSGSGSYRSGTDRPTPLTPIVRLRHSVGRRGSLLSTASEYRAVTSAFKTYIKESVSPSDIVIVTSAPPTTIGLAGAIHARRAIAIYWLQDYYPELLRTLWDYPLPIRKATQNHWDDRLARWDVVVKVAGNLAYHGGNARVIRNWPTIELGKPEPAIPRTALYSGNLGYCHHIPSFLNLCERLRAEGYTITVRGDGVGHQSLPDWIHIEPTEQNLEELRRSYWRAEIHLVAAHPEIRGAVFPSKFWNSYSTGREIRTSGFAGEMLTELETIRRGALEQPLLCWHSLVNDLMARPSAFGLAA